MAARGHIKEDARIDAGTKVWGWELLAIHRAATKQRMSTAAWIRETLFDAAERELGAPMASFNPELQAAQRAALSKADYEREKRERSKPASAAKAAQKEADADQALDGVAGQIAELQRTLEALRSTRRR